MQCPSCFEDKSQATVCRHCGFDESVGPARMCLPFRHKLDGGHYIVGKILGSPGGFGVAYIAWDTVQGSVVVIKEFQGPASPHVSRVTGRGQIDVEDDYVEQYERSLAHFRRETKVLKGLRQRNIVRVLKDFDENNTSYYVMPFVSGMDLAQYLEKHGGKLPAAEVLSIAGDLLAALVCVHAAGTLHCDIKPSNVLLTQRKKKAILIDFGAARRLPPKDATRPVMCSKKYAPPELAEAEITSLGRWTDLYLLCATLYECLTGAPPPTAEERKASAQDPYVPIQQAVPDVDERLALFIDQGLCLTTTARPASAQQALQSLPELGKTTKETEKKASKVPRAWWAALIVPEALLAMFALLNPDSGGAVLVLMLACAGIWWAALKIREKLAVPAAVGIELTLVSGRGVRTPVHTMQPSESLIIGRSRDTDLHIDNVRLSARHVSISLAADGMFTLQDLNSRNHTYFQKMGPDSTPQAWQRVSSVTGREGRFMLGDPKDGGVQLEITQARQAP
jgi:serine/threonine protein kinase